MHTHKYIYIYIYIYIYVLLVLLFLISPITCTQILAVFPLKVINRDLLRCYSNKTHPFQGHRFTNR